MTAETGSVESPTVEPMLGGNELVANTLGEYARGQWKKIRSGDSGALPVIVGLIVIVIIFQAKNSRFLSAENLVNLIEQSGIFVMLGMAEVYALLLGEIDLSTGFVAGIGAAITGELATEPHNMNWALAVLIGLAACAAIGFIQGLIITRLGLPSFVVTLAGYLGWNGFLLYLINHDKYAIGGSISVTNKVLNDFVNGSMSNTASWIVTIVVIMLYAAFAITSHLRRRSAGLVTPPMALVLIKIGLLTICAVLVVLVCTKNRGSQAVHLSGIPWVAFVVLAVVVIYSTMLSRMKFGRYMYAIGGNAEAARRAGINIGRIKVLAFLLCSMTAGIAGLVYLSQTGGVGADIPGGEYVLYAVAAAVIGGTSLFGGRGKMSQAVLGGIVIAAIYNGMGLIEISDPGKYMVIAIVLLAAVTVDAVARRGRTT